MLSELRNGPVLCLVVKNESAQCARDDCQLSSFLPIDTNANYVAACAAVN